MFKHQRHWSSELTMLRPMTPLDYVIKWSCNIGIIIGVASLIALLISIIVKSAKAQTTTPTITMKSFAYINIPGCAFTGSDLLKFPAGNGYDWQAGLGHAMPGAGQFPTSNFYIRTVIATFSGSLDDDQYAYVGHGGPDGDAVSGFVLNRHTNVISFPLDAAPKFTIGTDYFDIHSSNCNYGSVSFTIFWTPADQVKP